MTKARVITFLVARIANLYMAYALVISYMHIVTAAHMMGMTGWQVWTVPAAIDGFAILGLIGRSEIFPEAFRRVALRFQIGAGMVSLAGNIAAGHNLGERIWGVLVVGMFLAAETFATTLTRRVRAHQAKIEADRLAVIEADRIKAEKAAQAAARREAAAEAKRKRDEANERRRITREMSKLTKEIEANPTGVSPVSAMPFDDRAYL